MKISDIPKKKRPVRVIQFGGGVFLRGFFDAMMAKANACGVYDGDAVIIRSRTAGQDPLAAQNYRYTHIAMDAEHTDVTLVDCIAGSLNPADDFEAFLKLAENPDTDTVVSNTTEAGIVYVPTEKPTDKAPESYPARLAALLCRRFEKGLGGMLILPCELIEENGDTLKEILLRHARDWKLGEAFERYLTEECSFRNTLVDRIVSGKPTEALPVTLPFEDEMVNTSEYFLLWCIEGKEDERMPFAKAGFSVRFVPDIRAYHTLKVRILNGAHTAMIPYALLSGLETVGDCMKDKTMRAFLEACLFEEILPSLDFDEKEAKEYAGAVLNRFTNPFLHHACSAISLNSVSKFRVRVLPSILAYKEKMGTVPGNLMFSFSRLLKFYREGTPRDDEKVIEKMRGCCIGTLLADTELWGRDISDLREPLERAMYLK